MTQRTLCVACVARFALAAAMVSTVARRVRRGARH